MAQNFKRNVINNLTIMVDNGLIVDNGVVYIPFNPYFFAQAHSYSFIDKGFTILYLTEDNVD